MCIRAIKTHRCRPVLMVGGSVLRSCTAAIVASRRSRVLAGEERRRGTPIVTARTIESDKGDRGASHLVRAGPEPSLSLPTTVCVSRASSTSSSWSSRRSRSPQPPPGRMVTEFSAFHPFACSLSPLGHPLCVCVSPLSFSVSLPCCVPTLSPCSMCLSRIHISIYVLRNSHTRICEHADACVVHAPKHFLCHRLSVPLFLFLVAPSFHSSVFDIVRNKFLRVFLSPSSLALLLLPTQRWDFYFSATHFDIILAIHPSPSTEASIVNAPLSLLSLYHPFSLRSTPFRICQWILTSGIDTIYFAARAVHCLLIYSLQSNVYYTYIINFIILSAVKWCL